MSGVCGCDKIQSRENFKIILNEVNELIKGFPGFTSLSPTGSYNSDLNKTKFGDMDLITQIDGIKYNFNKQLIKKELSTYLLEKSPTVVVEFTSKKYAGRRYYNSGEIITIAFKSKYDNINAIQVDFIISMNEIETEFKLKFLDMPASKQAFVLGLVKTALIEEKPTTVFNRIGIDVDIDIELDQEFEFNLSSTEIQLRKVTYYAGTLKQKNRTIVWTSRDWNTLTEILINFDLTEPFSNIVIQAIEVLDLHRSYRRLSGVFKSMLSIKSGEVGKEKGNDKQYSLDLVQYIFGKYDD